MDQKDTRQTESDRFFSYAVDLLCVAGFDGYFQQLSKSWEACLGYTASELLEKPLLHLVHPEDRPEAADQLRQLMSGSAALRFENRCRCKDGSYRSLAWRGVAVEAQRQIYAVARDITDIKIQQNGLRETVRQKTAALVRTEEALDAIIEAAPAAIIALDTNGNITMWNKGAERIFGWTESEVLGGPLPYVADGEERKESQRRAREVLQGKPFQDLGATRLRKDGRPVELSLSLSPLKDEDGNIYGHIAVAIDITEKKMLESQLFRAQRMNSIGTLAGGIAHDLNNVLAPIMMGVQMLRLQSPESANDRVLETIERSAVRGSDLAKQVLTFARGLQGERALLHVRHVIEELEQVLKQTFPKAIDLEFNIPKDLWSVTGDATQLHQVLLNLCINARDAMNERAGTLTISAENAVIDASYAAMNAEAKPGPYLYIRVEDTGSGIPDHILESIFEPFFTTKGAGEGTGLGLSTSLAIVKGHGGFMNVYSEVGKGTSFKVYLPAQPARKASLGSERPAGPPMGAGELILIVDDEAAVRDIARATLEAYNYRVITADDGAEGIATYLRNVNDVRLILTDNSMPVMDGDSMIRAIEKLNPAARVISASGLVLKGKVAAARSPVVKSFLPKPFTAQQLLATVHEVLSAPGDF
jgi:PAS domain S-box-containing protein